DDAGDDEPVEPVPLAKRSPDVAATAVTAYSPAASRSPDSAGDTPPEQWEVRGSLQPEARKAGTGSAGETATTPA
ncbi:MAG: hypothetical protein LPK92_05195, partial [Actinomycetes bacterium]|nr:hypothetical protein [Actinomycetes bacterium]